MNAKILIAVIILLVLAVFGFSQLGSNPNVELVSKVGKAGAHSPSARLPELPMHIEFDQANNRIVSKQENNEIIAWDIATGTRTLLAKTNQLFAYCPSQQLLLTSETEGVFLLDLKDNRRRLVIEGPYHHAAWSTDCSTFAIANQDAKELKRWRTADMTNHLVIYTGLPIRNGLILSQDGSIIATAEGTYTDDKGHDTKLEVFSIDTNGAYTRRSPKDESGTVLGIWQMAFTPDGQSLIVGSQTNGQAGLRSLVTNTAGERWRKPKLASTWIRGLATSPDGRLIASGDEKGQLRIWNVANGNTLHESDTGLVIQSISFSADSKQLAAALWDSTISIFSLSEF